MISSFPVSWWCLKAGIRLLSYRSRKTCLRPGELPVVHQRELVELGHPARALDLAAGEVDQPVQVPQVAVLQERIGHHREERRRERHRDAEVDALLLEPVEHLDERDVRLGDRLVEPVLLEEVLVLGMPHVGEVRVEDERQVPLALILHRMTGAFSLDFFLTSVSIVRSSTPSPETAVTGISIVPSGSANRVP